ncbi:MAG: protein of unassigned function [Chthoniobacteraceae bacterium]|nr:protein of unassigned function [Chthoniobacteraceae bacterium]
MSIEPEISIKKPDVDGYEEQSLRLGGFPIESIMIRSETRSVFEVDRRIKSKQYVMDPDFQRDFVWDQERQSKLIESALLRIPLPVFYLAETLDGKIVVVDGLQRLTTFHRFLNNDFKLKGLGFSDDLNGRKFRDLPPALQNRIEDTPLQLYLIDSQVPESAKYEIFERVNSGVPLTRQQMRNGLFTGQATHWLDAVACTEEFLEATGRSLNSKTMRDRECINRFAAFQLNGWQNYAGEMDDFLGKTLSQMNKGCDLVSLTANFLKSMKLNLSVQGAHAFRKSLITPESRSVLNVALFDVLSVVFACASETLVKQRNREIVTAIRSLIQDPGFDLAISRSTNSVRMVRTRFEMAETLLLPLLL